jgi:hypothetical protein
MAVSVVRRRSVRERKASPITRFSRLMAASTRARRVYPDVFCQTIRPCFWMLWRCRSPWVGVISTSSLNTAVDRGGTIGFVANSLFQSFDYRDRSFRDRGRGVQRQAF